MVLRGWKFWPGKGAAAGRGSFSGRASWTGLEIGFREIRIVRLAGRGEEVAIEGSATAALPPGLVQKGRLEDPELAADMVRDTLAGRRLKGRCVLALPGEALLVRFLGLPAALSPAEMADAARWTVLSDVAELVPDPVVDCQQTARAVVEGEDVNQVMAVVISRPVLEGYVELARALNLRPLAAEPSFLSLLRICRSALAGRGKVNALLDIHRENSWLLVLERDELHFCRNIPAGAAALPELIQEVQLAGEFYTSVSGRRIEEILIAGASPGELEEAALSLEEGLSLPVRREILSPLFSGWEDFCRWGRAYGAALRGLRNEDLGT
ncbi:MAG: pilus assembly protein PilM [Armatimonadetes bacterium]|nr:pilus assembly protein PilM [Armatimonadota bacterium]